MLSVDIYHNQSGEKTGNIKLSSEIFGIKPKEELIQQVVVAMQAGLRRSTAHTKSRGDVRGGGKKPWQQKGTGRARVGSIRSPLWRGGGIIFGPKKERNFTKKINKKVRRQALLMTLSDKVSHGQLIVVDGWDFNQPKTKLFFQLLQKLPIKNKKSLFLFSPAELNINRLAKNIQNITTLPVANTNVLDILKNAYLLVSQSTIKILEAGLKQ